MEELHYPGAAATRKFLEERMAREQAAMQQQAIMQQQMMAQQAAMQRNAQPLEIPEEVASAVDERARRDAMATLGIQ